MVSYAFNIKWKLAFEGVVVSDIFIIFALLFRLLMSRRFKFHLI